MEALWTLAAPRVKQKIIFKNKFHHNVAVCYPLPFSLQSLNTDSQSQQTGQINGLSSASYWCEFGQFNQSETGSDKFKLRAGAECVSVEATADSKCDLQSPGLDVFDPA